MRGIEYYTGNIFEANLLFKVKNQKGQEVEFGSIGGGGRYDGLYQGLQIILRQQLECQ